MGNTCAKRDVLKKNADKRKVERSGEEVDNHEN